MYLRILSLWSVLMIIFFDCSAESNKLFLTNKEKLLAINTMNQLRAISQSDVDALLSKKYTGVILNGHHEIGDTPIPIVYRITSASYTDDNGAVIEVNGLKLYHEFNDSCDMSYYGLKPGVNSEQVADFNTKSINTALQKFKKVTIRKKGVYYFRGNRGGEGGSYYRHKDNFNGTYWGQVGDGGGQPGGILIPSNRVFEMSSGVELRQRATFMQAYNLITLWNANNVVIRGGRVVGDLDSHDNRDGGEWGYGLFIQGCDNVLVENFEITKLWADGIHISVDVFNSFKESSNITFKNVKSTYNRRQGMSVCGGKNLRFESCTFSNTGATKYTAPGFGVDIENDIKNVKVENVTFYNCLFEKNYGGARTVHNGKDKTSVSFVNCVFKNNRTVNYDSFSAGGIVFQNCDFGHTASHPYGFELMSSFDIRFLKCKFSNRVYFGKRNEQSLDSRDIQFEGCTITVKKGSSHFFTVNGSKNIRVNNNVIIQEGAIIDLKKKWEAEAGKSLNFIGNQFK